MAESLTLLCSLIVEDLYGSLFSQIFHVLAQRGRSTLNQIAQICHLPLRQVKAGVAGLIQLQLLCHHTTSDGISTYQANLGTAYKLLRVGRLANLASRAHGRVAAIIVEELAHLGFARVRELEAHVLDRLCPTEDDSRLEHSQLFTEVLGCLIGDKFVYRLRKAHLQARFDARKDVEVHIANRGPNITTKGKKARGDFDEAVDLELEMRLDTWISEEQLRSLPVANGVDPNGTRSHTGHDSCDDLFICVDYSKVVKSVRNNMIAEKYGHIFGKKTANIISTVLVQVDLEPVEYNDQPKKALSSKQQISIEQLKSNIKDELLQARTQQPPQVNGWHDRDIRVNGNHNPAHIEIDDFDDEDIRYHLSVVAEGPMPFLGREGTSGLWFVNRAKLKEEVQDQEIARLMRERVGDLGLRLIRMLKDKGKLDEKNLQEIGLLGAKDLRQTLAKLQTMGFSELQEVPREPQRQPNRTMFLWFYDPERVRNVLLGDLYQSMARVYQHLQLERGRLSTTLGKIERIDVQGCEEEILSPAELLILQQWRKKEAWLKLEIDRLDASVALLRDV